MDIIKIIHEKKLEPNPYFCYRVATFFIIYEVSSVPNTQTAIDLKFGNDALWTY